jgi:hypothetical protein
MQGSKASDGSAPHTRTCKPCRATTAVVTRTTSAAARNGPTCECRLPQPVVPKSDTPREAGGLMSWAASKAVGLGV